MWKNISYENGVLKTESGEFPVNIDLVLAGSPCQGFSLMGKQLAFEDPRSKLYFKFEEILKQIQEHNPEVKFLLENVEMAKDHKDIITQRLGVDYVRINSSRVSAQNRRRLYWTNISGQQELIDKNILLKDVLESAVDEKYIVGPGRLKWLQDYRLEKEKGGFVAFNPKIAKCLTARMEPSWNCTYIVQRPHGFNTGGIKAEDGKVPTITSSGWEHNNFLRNGEIVRKLTPKECERLQTVPDGYTSCVSDHQAYRMLGNGWTVDVVAHLLEPLTR